MAIPVFFPPSRELTIGDIADFTGADLRELKFARRAIRRLASIENASEDALVFVEGKKNIEELEGTKAAAVLCTDAIAANVPCNTAVLVTYNPHRDFSSVGRLLFPTSVRPQSFLGETGISPAAIIHPTTHVEDGATIEAGAVIGENVKIGTGTLISATAVIGAGCQIGRNSYIAPGVHIQFAIIGNRVSLHPGVRIGQDGFGYVPGPSGLEKVPQLGRVIIQDDVEVGANTTIDRGTLNDTVIGEGTKIDNLVQIAHNVRIGRFCLIAAHCGISGSCTIGDQTVFGGLVGVADHLAIGASVQIAAGSGIINDIPDGERWGGFPARPIKQWFRDVVNIRDIELSKQLSHHRIRK